MGLQRQWKRHTESKHEHDEGACPECSSDVAWVEIPAEWLGPEYLDFALVRDAQGRA